MATSSNKKKIQIKEFQDAHGISRKHTGEEFPPNLFIILKLALIVLIPIVYFVYSPALIFLMVMYACLFFVARLAENSLNKGVVRSNHIKLPKFDSAIALLVIVIAVFGTFLAGTAKTKEGTFDRMNNTQIEGFMKDKNFDFEAMQKQATWSKFKAKLINMGSLLTGERNVFSSLFDSSKDTQFNFGTMKPPDDFISDKKDLQDIIGSGDFTPPEGGFPGGGNFPGGKGGFNKNGSPNFKFSMDNIPIEYTFSTALTSVTTILIFLVPSVGLVSVLYSIAKRKKFNKDMVEVIIEDKIELLNDAELERILSFGEEQEEIKISKTEINKKIKLEHQATCEAEKVKKPVVEEIVEDEIADDFGF